MDKPIIIPAPTQDLYDELTRVPVEVAAIIPLETLGVPSLIAHQDLPLLLDTSMGDLLPAAGCIANNIALATNDQARRSPIPPRKWLGALELELKQRLGVEPLPASILHPEIPGPSLPLWVIGFWNAVLPAVQQRATWVKATAWLHGQGQAVSGKGFREAEGLMANLMWGTIVWATPEDGTLVGILGELLSADGWLRERQLDVAASYLNFCSRGHERKWWVGNPWLATLLKQLPPKPATLLSSGHPSDLFVYQDRIKEGGYRRFLFPANLNNNHWIAFSVDLDTKEFRYGVSLTALVMDIHVTYHWLMCNRGLARA
jgi:hypothetical protein